jgi:DNA-binding NarL/FixJ family response regulator
VLLSRDTFVDTTTGRYRFRHRIETAIGPGREHLDAPECHVKGTTERRSAGGLPGSVPVMSIRVVVAEDSLLMREGIVSVIGLDGDVDLVATCLNYDELLTAVDEHVPDVVVTDIRMPPTQTDEGIRAANTIRGDHPDIGVVVLSQYVEPDYALHLFEHGSDGRAYLLKERVADPGELVDAIRRVHEGDSVIDPKVVETLIAARTKAARSPLDRLSDRELEVLAEIAKGGSNAAIGEALFISERSVEKHINSIFTKLDLTQEPDTNRRVRAVLIYLSESGS